MLAVDGGWLEVYRLPSTESITLPLNRRAIMHLELYVAHVEPFITTAAMSTGRSRSPKGTYESASRVTILQGSARASKYGPSLTRYVFVIRTDIFEMLLDQYLPCCRLAEEVDGELCDPAILVDWHEWGPHNAKLLDYPSDELVYNR